MWSVVCVCRVDALTMKWPAQYADLKRTWDAIEVRNVMFIGGVFVALNASTCSEEAGKWPYGDNRHGLGYKCA